MFRSFLLSPSVIPCAIHREAERLTLLTGSLSPSSSRRQRERGSEAHSQRQREAGRPPPKCRVDACHRRLTKRSPRLDRTALHCTAPPPKSTRPPWSSSPMQPHNPFHVQLSPQSINASKQHLFNTTSYCLFSFCVNRRHNWLHSGFRSTRVLARSTQCESKCQVRT